MIAIELNLRKTKWLLLPCYRPPTQNEAFFINQVKRAVDFYSRHIDNLFIFGDLNMETSSPELKKFIEQYGLYSLIKTPTCYKSREGRWIDLMLTNNHRCFFGSQSFETGFSDFHYMVYYILKTTFVRIPPKKVNHRDYRKFSEQDFMNDFVLSYNRCPPNSYEEFEKLVVKVLDRHAPLKTAIFLEGTANLM